MSTIQTNTGGGNITVNATTVWDRIVKLEENVGVVGTPIKEQIDELSSQLAETTSKFAGLHISVKDKQFGAKGDGTTDDTAAIQLALDYSDANKCYIYFPKGTYLVKGTLKLGYNAYIIGSIDGQATSTASSYPNAATHTSCKIYFNSTDKTIPLFTGKTGITGGLIIFQNIEFTTLYPAYYPEEYNANTLVYDYDMLNQSLFYNVQVNHFTYVFSNLAFEGGSRLTHNFFKYIGGAVFYQSRIVDSHIHDNYFNGMSKPCASFMLDCTGFTTTLVVNNWFEFFKYVFMVRLDGNSTMQGCLISSNFFDYTYRLFDSAGNDYTITGNIVSHSNKSYASANSYPWIVDTEAMNDNDWVSIKVRGFSGIAITGNMGRMVDRFIELIGDGQVSGSALKQVSTFGNVLNTATSTTPITTPDRLIKVSVGQSSWLGSAHLSNMRLSELNDWNYTSAPTTNLVPGRTAFINNKRVILDSNYNWRYTDDGFLYGYKSKGLIPVFSDASWGLTGTWTTSNNGYTAVSSGYSTTGWENHSVTIASGSNLKYRLNTRTPYYASDGTTVQGIEIHFFNGATEITNSAIFYDQRTGEKVFTTPTGTTSFVVKIIFNYKVGVTYTYDTLILTPYSESDYGNIVTGINGGKHFSYVDGTGTLITQRYA